MSPFTETANFLGSELVRFSLLMLWQSSLLIAVIFAIDFAFRRKLRPAVLYALWLVVLIKLILPPSFAFPTGAGWWLRSHTAAKVERSAPVMVTYVAREIPNTPQVAQPALPLPASPRLSPQAWALPVFSLPMLTLFVVAVIRSRNVARAARCSIEPPEWLAHLASELIKLTGKQRALRIRLSSQPISPAVCGLVRPTMLLPCPLVSQLSRSQLRAVLLHEMTHVRRGDIWVNCIQTILQILYWWHPLVWLANARIRRLREESVDDAVMVALGPESHTYAPTLIEVARVVLKRLAPTLGLLGILESRNALTLRIKRLLEFPPPKKSGVTLGSMACIVAFSALAVPMGEAPPKSNGSEMQEEAWSAPNPSLRILQPARQLFEAGKLEEAEARVKEALTLPPENQPGLDYLGTSTEARSNLIAAGKEPVQGRKSIGKKLDSIHVDVLYDHQTLGDVVRSLNDAVKKADPEKRGVDFIIDGTVPISFYTNRPAFALGDVLININPRLINISLADALDAIVKVANEPISYVIADNSVIFSLRGHQSVPLYLRTFSVDPEKLARGIEAHQDKFGGLTPHTTGPMRANDPNFFAGVKSFFRDIGVDLFAPGKTAYLNYTEGTLLVRASLRELDLVETALTALNAKRDPPPGNTHSISNQMETASKAPLKAAAPAPPPQPQIVIHATFVELPERALRSRHLKLATDSSPRIWDPSELEALKKIKDANVLSAQNVTTFSGLQAKIKTAEMKTVVNGVKWPVPAALVSSEQPPTNSAMTPTYLTETISVGPGLDVFPVLETDGKTIDLDMVAKVTEFLGYDKDQRAESSGLHVPLPHFRVNSISTHGRISDGECLLLPALKATDLYAKSDARADMNPGRNSKAILVFVRATVQPPDTSVNQK